LIVTAIVELGAGAMLAVAPSALTLILLGERLDAPAAVAVARIAGVALLALALACGMAVRDHAPPRPAQGIIAAMLLYNCGAVAVLVYAAIVGLRGIGLWPTAVLHAAIALWCFASLAPRHGRPDAPEGQP